MKKSLFLDTNIVLDIVLERPQFLREANELLVLSDDNVVELFVSALTVANAAYFAKKFDRDPITTVKSLLKWFQVIDLKKQYFESAMFSKFNDFDDSLQFFSAKEIRAIDYIITKDVNDFRGSSIPVLSPTDFLENYK